MSLSHLILEALTLMGVGMLSVGLFLGILVFLIPLLNKIVPDDPTPPPAKPATAVNNGVAAQNDTLIAVISAAIQQHRNRRH